MKIVTVIGARPQFIKAAAVSRIMQTEYNHPKSILKRLSFTPDSTMTIT